MLAVSRVKPMRGSVRSRPLWKHMYVQIATRSGDEFMVARGRSGARLPEASIAAALQASLDGGLACGAIYVELRLNQDALVVRTITCQLSRRTRLSRGLKTSQR